MLTKTVLSLAVVLGAATGALAATKHPVHHHRSAVELQAPGAAYNSFGSANGARTGRLGETGSILTRDRPSSFSLANGSNPYFSW
jgi:hypothetical protein